jgi:hypothetical protein
MKNLAASFIVTVGLLPACTMAPPPPRNPPPPEATVEAPPPPPEPTAPVDVEEPPPKVDDGLPEAKEGQKVVKQPDGTCMAYFDVDCPPPPATCNPPPPMKVKCPPDK